MSKSTNFLTTGLKGRGRGAVIGTSPSPKIEDGASDQVIKLVVIATNVKAHVVIPVQRRNTYAKYATNLVILRQFAIKREAKLLGGKEKASSANQEQIRSTFTRCRVAQKVKP